MGLTGAITNNAFWFGVGLFIVASQESMILVVLHVTLHKMGNLLKELETQLKMDYKLQRRKLWIIRLGITGIILSDMCIQFTREDSFLNGVLHPGPPTDYNPQVFQLTAPLLSVVLALAHLTLVYAMQRPPEASRPSTAVAMTTVQVERTSKLSITHNNNKRGAAGDGATVSPPSPSLPSSKLSERENTAGVDAC